MEIAKVVARRSNCTRRQLGAVVVKDKLLLSTGYNGTPRNLKNCSEGGCPRCNGNVPSGKDLDKCFCVHAEENSIIQAAYHGMSIRGGTLYTINSPCIFCTKTIINGGIEKVVYNEGYSVDGDSKKLLAEAKIKIIKLDPQVT
jgi:dCMP deaminase